MSSARSMSHLPGMRGEEWILEAEKTEPCSSFSLDDYTASHNFLHFWMCSRIEKFIIHTILTHSLSWRRQAAPLFCQSGCHAYLYYFVIAAAAVIMNCQIQVYSLLNKLHVIFPRVFVMSLRVNSLDELKTACVCKYIKYSQRKKWEEAMPRWISCRFEHELLRCLLAHYPSTTHTCHHET